MEGSQSEGTKVKKQYEARHGEGSFKKIGCLYMLNTDLP